MDGFTSITLEKNNEEITIETNDNVKSIINKLNNLEKVTTPKSIQDIPVNMEDEIKITFNDEKNTTIYTYMKNNNYYIEQPYNGIYEITKEEYRDINDFYENLREEVTELEKVSLTKIVEKLEVADWLGKSFKVSDLINEELLRLSFEMFGPTKNFGFEDITFENLERTYIKGNLGRDDAEPKDITCLCDKVIAKYNSSNDTYTWDNEFHYLDYKSNVYNEILDMYKVEDKYIIEVEKDR